MVAIGARKAAIRGFSGKVILDSSQIGSGVVRLGGARKYEGPKMGHMVDPQCLLTKLTNKVVNQADPTLARGLPQLQPTDSWISILQLCANCSYGLGMLFDCYLPCHHMYSQVELFVISSEAPERLGAPPGEFFTMRVVFLALGLGWLVGSWLLLGCTFGLVVGFGFKFGSGLWLGFSLILSCLGVVAKNVSLLGRRTRGWEVFWAKQDNPPHISLISDRRMVRVRKDYIAAPI